MALEFGTFQRGGVVFPLAPATTNPLLFDADPAVYTILDFLGAMLAEHAGARFTAQAAAAGLVDPSNATITDIVGSKLPYSSGPYLASEQLRFPLLCAYRATETSEERTTSREQTTTIVKLEFVLPPLSAAQQEQVGPFLTVVSKILSDRTERGFDPSYTPPFVGAVAGASAWKACGIGRAEVKRGAYGMWEVADGLSFPAYTCELVIDELAKSPPGQFARMTSINTDHQLPTDGVNGVMDHVVDTTVTTS